jgi:hypothetical protein
MRLVILFLTVLLPAGIAAAQQQQLFNGKDLTHWEGLTGYWSVEDGCLTGQTSKEHSLKSPTYLVYKAAEFADFELTCKVRFIGTGSHFGNSGIQYRTTLSDTKNYDVLGYQADMANDPRIFGALYHCNRGMLAWTGETRVFKNAAGGAKSGKATVAREGSLGKAEEILGKIDYFDWNDYRIVAKGNHLQHFVNGKMTIDVVDESSEGAARGIIALQLHPGPPMKVQFKEIILKPIR